VLLYGIPNIVIGENQNFVGAEELLRSRGVKLTVLQAQECIQMMSGFIEENPSLWNEDIGM
ncbi:MAG: nucleoside deaminase, partial [Bacteroidetes bacterium]|jgi:cytosine deaminase|nr:nucleoside deaminase [Bacteroidota bacterium]